jgi:DNA-binding MarR family transcriptional regulator
MERSTSDAPTLRRSPAVPAWLRLARIFQRIDRASAEWQRRHDLTLAQFDVLAHVGASDGITQQALANALLVTKGHVCQILDRMEARGLIRRERHGRENLLHLTDAGRALFAQAVPDQEALIAGQFASLTPDEVRELLKLLRKLDRSLRPRAAASRAAAERASNR